MAPELNNSHNKIDLGKCYVFSLGMILLELSSLKTISFFNNMTENKIDNYIKENLHSIYVRDIIIKMIREDPKTRSCFTDLAKIKKTHEIIISDEEFFAIGKKLKEFLNSNNEEVKSIDNVKIILK